MYGMYISTKPKYSINYAGLYRRSGNFRQVLISQAHSSRFMTFYFLILFIYNFILVGSVVVQTENTMIKVSFNICSKLLSLAIIIIMHYIIIILIIIVIHRDNTTDCEATVEVPQL